MTRENDEIRDPYLAARLREALGSDTAPEAWVRDALEIPAQAAGWSRGVGPRRAALAVAAGIVVVLPALIGLWRSLEWLMARPGGAWVELSPASLWTPVILLLLADGARGFPAVRRWLL